MSIVEEISRRTRDARQELRKHMREVRKHCPEKKCKLGYDILEVDNKIFVYRSSSQLSILSLNEILVR